MTRKTPLVLFILGILMVPVSARAGSKSKTFDVPADVLYESAVQTAAQTHKLISSDAGRRRFSFRTASWGLEVHAGVQPSSSNSSQLILDVQNADSRQPFAWGAGGRMADKFFKDVETSLGAWRPVVYRLALTKPVESEALVFEDDNLRASFALSRKAINFSLKNKTDGPLKIDWNQWSYVDVDGNSHRIFHKGIAYKDRETSLPPSVIPPTATFEDVVFPSDYSRWSDVGGGFQSLDLLPQAVSASAYVGKTLSLFMPLEVNNTVKNYLFSFKIKEAQVQGGTGK
jgi:hypothetical protein